jgi:Tol biopolymer transport system component
VSSALNVNSENQRRRIYRNEISTGKETDLLVDRGEAGNMPLVSPDERWLVFHGNLEGSTKHSLLLLPIEGGALRALDIDDMQFPGLGWTPDSKRLLVSRRVKRVNGQGPDSELYWVSVEGGAPQSMGIRMNGLSSPSLNPDGKRLLFSSTETSNELWVLRNLPLK